MAETLETWDIVLIVGYFAIVFAVGIIATVTANRGTSKGFFLAGKSMTWLPIAGSLFATNMGAPTFVGLAGSGAGVGFAPVMFEWHATYMLVLLGWIFVPIYMASNTFTMPGYLCKRYGGKRIRIYYAVVQLVLITLTGISGEVYAGTLFIQQLLGWNIYLSTVLILSITAIYTIGGGLAAVIYTDALQAVILVGGGCVLTAISVTAVGGYEAMTYRFEQAIANTTYIQQSQFGNTSCGIPPSDSFKIFRGVDSSYPWPGLVFGLTLLATYFFCTNQVMVQRNLAAKTVSHSKAGCVATSYLKILPFFLFVMPGMVSRILFPDEVGCSDPDICERFCGNRAGCTNLAYPVLVLRMMPQGLRGLMLAALLAALMSSLTSMFNSSSSIFTIDVWKNIRPKANDKEVVIVGRLFGLVMVGLAVAWLPVLQVIQGTSLWDYLQSISSYVTPPWVVVFLLGMFWKRTTEQGAWWGLMAGAVAGISRAGVHFSYPTPSCGGGEADTRPEVFTKVHYLHFAIILAAVSFFVTVAVSLITKPRAPEKLRRVTWWTRKSPQPPDLTDDEESEEEEEEEDERESAEEMSKAKKCYNVACGFDKKPPKLTAEEKAELDRIATDITEDKWASRFCDINAVIAVGLTCFIIGFYA